MDEPLPGLFHWTAFHDGIGQQVHSALLAPARTLIDPMEPPEGLGAFGGEGAGPPAPERILLTNRHHLRHSARFVERFGCTVHCHEAGLHEFSGGGAPDVRGFAWGDEPAPGVLALADAVIGDGHGGLAFVPDPLLGEDPEGVKRGLLAAFERLLGEDFDVLLLAHGAPVLDGAPDALRAFVEDARRRA